MAAAARGVAPASFAAPARVEAVAAPVAPQVAVAAALVRVEEAAAAPAQAAVGAGAERSIAAPRLWAPVARLPAACTRRARARTCPAPVAAASRTVGRFGAVALAVAARAAAAAPQRPSAQQEPAPGCAAARRLAASARGRGGVIAAPVGDRRPLGPRYSSPPVPVSPYGGSAAARRRRGPALPHPLGTVTCCWSQGRGDLDRRPYMDRSLTPTTHGLPFALFLPLLRGGRCDLVCLPRSDALNNRKRAGQPKAAHV